MTRYVTNWTSASRPMRRIVLTVAGCLLLAGPATGAARPRTLRAPTPRTRTPRPPTRLWYRLRIDYRAELHRHATYSVPTFAEAPTLRFGPTDYRHDEAVVWVAHTLGSVLVRIRRGGKFDIYSGALAGHLYRADSSDTTTLIYRCWGNFRCVDLSAPASGECSQTTELSLASHGPSYDFVDPVLISVGTPSGWNPPPSDYQVDSMVQALSHTTGDLERCEPVMYPPDAVRRYPAGNLPMAPNFDEATVKDLEHDEPVPHFAKRGPDRFGAGHPVLDTGGGFNTQMATGAAYPQPTEIDTSGKEAYIFSFDRCPGTRPC